MIQIDGEDINQIQKGSGQTPLMAGVLSGKFESVKLLLEMGADVTIGEKDGYTPMHAAGFQGRDKIAELLIDHGIDPNGVHKDGFAPIHRACWGMKTRHWESYDSERKMNNARRWTIPDKRDIFLTFLIKCMENHRTCVLFQLVCRLAGDFC